MSCKPDAWFCARRRHDVKSILVRSRHCLYCLSGWNAYYGGAFLPGGRMASTTVAKLPPYPSHPYHSSTDLAQLLVNNGLTGIGAQDLAGCIDLVGYYPSRATGIRSSPPWRAAGNANCPSCPTHPGIPSGNATCSTRNCAPSSSMASSASRSTSKATWHQSWPRQRARSATPCRMACPDSAPRNTGTRSPISPATTSGRRCPSCGISRARTPAAAHLDAGGLPVLR